MDTKHNNDLIAALQEAEPSAAPELADNLAAALQKELDQPVPDEGEH